MPEDCGSGSSNKEIGRRVTLRPSPVQYDMASVGQRIMDAEAALKKARAALDDAGQKIVEAAAKVEAVPEEACPVCACKMEDARLIVVSVGSCLAGVPAKLFRARCVVLPKRGQRITQPRHGYELRVCKECRNGFLTMLEEWVGKFRNAPPASEPCARCNGTEDARLVVVSLGSWGDNVPLHMALPASMDKERRNELMNLVVDWLMNTSWCAPVPDK